ncbi:hypothetical protein GCM10009559_48900 [Pseudonocardia zijingensis]|uniref:Uncharacterized protein n=1 Tax=Pseudonocardia zijingensis TaxID=153376 RepID=A0ABP4BFF1_9PSEU
MTYAGSAGVTGTSGSDASPSTGKAAGSSITWAGRASSSMNAIRSAG